MAESLPKRSVLVSVVTEIELLGFSGLSVEEETGILSLLSDFEIVPLHEGVKNKAIRLRRRLRLRLPDPVVLATTVVTGSELLTNDCDLLNKAGIVVSCRSP